MPVTVRRYEDADASATLGVFQRAVHVTAAADYSPEQRAAWAPETLDLVAWSERQSRRNAVVAEVDGYLVGFSDVDAEGHIDMLFVDPDHGRQGVATALMGWVRAEAARLGATRLSARASETARAFFEVQGFRVDERLTLSVGGVVMTACAMSADIGSLTLIDKSAAWSETSLVNAANGCVDLARRFRSGLEPAFGRMLDIASRVNEVPGADDLLPDQHNAQVSATLRHRVVDVLAELAPGVDSGRRARYCDTLWDLVATSPSPTWEWKSRWCDIRSSAVLALLDVGDPRWLELCDAVLADASGRTVWCGSVPLVCALGQRLEKRGCPPDQVLGLVGLIARELEVDGFADLSWFGVVKALPVESTASLAETVARLLAQPPRTMVFNSAYMYVKPRVPTTTEVLFGPDGQRHNPLVGMCAVLLARWRDPVVVAPLRRLADMDGIEAPWAEVILGAITGQANVDESVRRHGLPRYPVETVDYCTDRVLQSLWSMEDFFALWAKTPTPGLIEEAVRYAGGKAADSRPGRAAQLVAARIATAAGFRDQVWSTVLDIIDDAALARDAVETAMVLAGDDHVARDQLTVLLGQMCRPWNRTLDQMWSAVLDVVSDEAVELSDANEAAIDQWDALALAQASGPPVTVVACEGIDRLGAPMPAHAVTSTLNLLSSVAQGAFYRSVDDTRLACDLLVRLARRDPEQKRTVRAGLTALLSSDARISWFIADDIRFTVAVQHALDALGPPDRRADKERPEPARPAAATRPGGAQRLV